MSKYRNLVNISCYRCFCLLFGKGKNSPPQERLQLFDSTLLKFSKQVKFTKHLYCQLAQARFLPDHRSPWRLPPTNDTLYKAKELGYKLVSIIVVLFSKWHQISFVKKSRAVHSLQNQNNKKIATRLSLIELLRFIASY